MGRAKEEMLERQQEAAVLKGLGISAAALDGYGYDVAEDPFGRPHHARIMWDDEAPEGVEVEYDGERAFTLIEFEEEPDGPED